MRWRWRLLTFVVGLLCASGCVARTTPTPTPDPFVGVTGQAEAAYRQGVELFNAGRVREANEAFGQARLLSPTTDPRIEQMLDQTRALLTPVPTAEPETPTPLPSPTPVAQTSATPDVALGQAYLGQTFLSVVPAQDAVQPPMTTFYREDQVGLYIEGLSERLRLPFGMRVFNVDSGALVADVHGGDDAPSGTPTPGPAPAPAPATVELEQFFGHYVWYHRGGEAPGNYVVELYSGAALVQKIAYRVVDTPVVIPTATPVPEPTPVPAPPVAQPEPPTATPVPVPVPVQEPAPQAAPVAPVAPVPVAPQVVVVVATAAPAPSAATALLVPGVPVAVDGAGFVADGAGDIWTLAGMQPALGRPFSVSSRPTGLVSFDRLLVAVAGDSPRLLVLDAGSGQSLGEVDLPGAPGVVRLDAALGLAFVALPERGALATVDIGAQTVTRLTPGLPDLTSVAVDPDTHLVYVSQFSGSVAVIDPRTGEKTDAFQLADNGLTDVAAAGGMVAAINTPAGELVLLDPGSRQITHVPLGDQPSAVALDGRSVYVVYARGVARYDARGGAERGRVALPQLSDAQPGGDPGDQIALGSDGSVAVIRPAERSLWLARGDLFDR